MGHGGSCQLPLRGRAGGAGTALLLPYLQKGKRERECMRSTGCSGVGGVLNTYPVRPHLLGQSPAIAQHLARGRASARGAQLCSPEGKHEHIPEEREGFLLFSCWEVRGATCSGWWCGQSWHSRALLPPQHHQSQ